MSQTSYITRSAARFHHDADSANVICENEIIKLELTALMRFASIVFSKSAKDEKPGNPFATHVIYAAAF